MSEDEILVSVLDRLDALGISHMLAGSYASNIHGRPRSTHNADVVIDIQPDQAEAFIQTFRDDSPLEPDSIRRNVKSRTMFNLISFAHVFKIDLIPLRETPYHREEWARRTTVEAFGRKLFVATAEDTILSKLKWYRQSDGALARQLEDARSIIDLQRENLDRSHLTKWAKTEGVEDLLEQVWQ